jgi:organic radical activating enzyme
MKYSKDTICALPFTLMSNTNSGDYRTCCDSYGFGPNIQTNKAIDVWNSHHYKQLRLDLVNGVQNVNCASCWRAEANDGYSKRKNENKSFDLDALVSHMDSTGYLTAMPEIMDFKLGNLCNLKCIMCNQLSSSQHETEIKLWQNHNVKLPHLIEMIEVTFKNENQQYRFDKDNCQTVFDNLESVLKNLRKIRLVGGEPLINPIAHDMINRLVTQGYSDTVELEIISNLSQLNQNLIHSLEQFKSVNLIASFDHVVADKFHYIRYPADFNSFKANFESVLNNNKIRTKISTTFSIFNIFDIETIMAEFERYSHTVSRLAISFNWVSDPAYFSIAYLSDELKQQIVNNVKLLLAKDYKIFKQNNNLVEYLRNIETFLSTHVDFDTVVAERDRVLALYDSTRNTNHKQLYNFL